MFYALSIQTFADQKKFSTELIQKSQTKKTEVKS